MAKVNLVPNRQQHERRKGAVWTDQHGREWSVEIDIESFMPVSIPHLMRESPPIATPEKYVKPDPKKNGRLTIAYREWVRDILAREAERNLTMQGLATTLYGDQALNALQNPPPSLIAKVGSRPIPVEFVLAMEAGNKWALGLRKEDGSKYPQPSWVTSELVQRWRDALRTVWGPDDVIGDALPVAKSGQFYDEDETGRLDEAPPVVAEDDEVAPALSPRDFPVPQGMSNAPLPPPMKRGPGRPRKNPVAA